MTDVKTSTGGTKPSGFSVKDILDLPNVKSASSNSTETNLSLSGNGRLPFSFPLMISGSQIVNVELAVVAFVQIPTSFSRSTQYP